MRTTLENPSQYLSGTAKWILVGTALSCALLEIIDSTVVAVARPDMMGSLGATTLEIAWVISAYAIGNVITVPLSAMLSNLFGRKVYFTASVVLFTFSSLMCGLSSGLWMLVFWRFIQGLGGGGLLSTAQSIISDAFPPKELATATAIFGVGLMVGPAIGPVMGGYITDNWSWNWIFFINVPIGIVAAFLSWSFVPNLAEAVKPKRMDWWGILFLIIGLCSLQYFLEEGTNKYWFESSEIIIIFIVAITGLTAFVWRELTIDEPAVNIKLYKNFNLAVGHLLNLILGMMIVGMFFIFPLFTQVTLNWSATQQGVFLISGTIASAFAMIFVSKVVLKKLNNTITAIIGVILFSLFIILLSFSSPDSSEKNFFWPFIISGFGRAFLMVPLMSMALSGLRGKDLAQATGLSNIMRQLGSAIGIALMGIYLNHESVFVRSNMLGNINLYNNTVIDRITAYTQKFISAGYSIDDANRVAYQIIDNTLTKQQQIVCYDNAYMAVGLVILICIPLILLIRNKKII
ncbi:MAG: DHA2 family efflux MFS transporter permease subunit [Ignavibacteria bacterium]|nr:DHA2 family efflux MFS transporter permease subunit [Ignavibacteria bacterium]